jgi:hypothetical protein
MAGGMVLEISKGEHLWRILIVELVVGLPGKQGLLRLLIPKDFFVQVWAWRHLAQGACLL